MAQSSVIKCFNHVTCSNDGIFYCHDCKTPLCQQCRETHDRFPALANHSVGDIKSVNRSALTLENQCVVHKQQFSLYCNPCKALVCIECMVGEHNKHEVSVIDSIVGKLKFEAKEKIELLKEKLANSSQLMNKLESVYLPNIEKQTAIAISNINATVLPLEKLVNHSKDVKLHEVENWKNRNEKEVRNEFKTIERQYETQKSVCERLENIMKEKHCVTFIKSFENLKNEIYKENVELEVKEPNIPVFNPKIFLTDILKDIHSQFGIGPQASDTTELIKQIEVLELEKLELSKRIEEHQRDFRIALIGRCESGKSALGNTLLGYRKFESRISGESVTKFCEVGTGVLPSGHSLKVVDTPGIMNTAGIDVTNEVYKSVALLSPGPHAFIIVLSPGISTEIIENLERLFSDDEFFQHTIIVMVRRNDLCDCFYEPTDVHTYISTFAATHLGSLYEKCGRRIVAVENKSSVLEKTKYAEEIIREILKLDGYYSHSYFQLLQKYKTLQQKMGVR